MIRLLILGVLGYLIYQLFAGGKSAGGGKKSTARRPPADSGGRMVKCASCGLYVPENEAVLKRQGGGQVFYCSEKCAAGAKKKPD
ncbi:MAG: Prokaryotic metallothionein [Deltaproteobacteria bacterium]|jgi:hypothetical protein|nr:Prokaryotic metallothionein [Deltaproteobacteria bacterium]